MNCQKILFAFGLLPGFLSAVNLVPNSSFELGLSGLGTTNYHKGTPSSEWKPFEAVIDNTTAVHGKNSLKLVIPKKMECEFSFGDSKLTGAGTYTLSMYVKANRPGRIRPQLFMARNVKAGMDWSFQFKYVPVTTEWTRISIPVTVRKEFSYGLVQLILDDNPMTLWVDAVQLEKGKQLTDYTPLRDVESYCDVIPPKFGYAGQKDFSLKLVNYQKSSTRINADIAVCDTTYETKKELLKKQIEIPAESTIAVPLRHDFQRYGMYKITGEVAGNPLEAQYYTVFAELPQEKFDPEQEFAAGCGSERLFTRTHRKDPYAVQSTTNRDFEQDIRLLQISGNRMFRYWADWMQIEPEKGKLNWELADFTVNLLCKYGIVPMFVLGNTALSTHKTNPNRNWFIVKRSTQGGKTLLSSGSVRNFPRMSDWEKHIRDVVSHFKGRVRYYEICNEPNLFYTPEEYVPYLKAAYKTAKETDPDCKVIGVCATGDRSGSVESFIDACGKLGAYDHCDIVSFHPYNAQLDSDGTPAEDQIRAIHGILDKYRKGIPIWNTELYYIHSRQENSRINGTDVSYQERDKLRPEHLVRRMLIDFSNGVQHSLAPAASQFKHFDQTNIPVPPTWKPQPENASTAPAVAQNTFTRFTRGVKAGERWIPIRGTNGCFFRSRDGRETAAVWSVLDSDQFRLNVKPGIKCYDLFSNPVDTGKILILDSKPLWFAGKNLKKDIRIEPAFRFAIRGSRLFAVPEGARLVLNVFNTTEKEQRLKIKVKGTKDICSLTIPARRSAVAELNVPDVKMEYPLLISDDAKIYHSTIRVEPPRKNVKSGKQVSMPYGSFFARAEKDALSFCVKVNDNKRGARPENNPWEGDCIEFFIDTKPKEKLDQGGRYHNKVFRLFAAPASSNGLEKSLTASPNADLGQIKWAIRENGANYIAFLTIPWSALGETERPDMLTFDITVNDNDTDSLKRQNAVQWAGGGSNCQNRFLFGTLNY